MSSLVHPTLFPVHIGQPAEANLWNFPVSCFEVVFCFMGLKHIWELDLMVAHCNKTLPFKMSVGY